MYSNTSYNDHYEIEYNIPLFVSLTIFSMLVIVGNIITIIVIVLNRSLCDVTGFLMINLAVADLGVGLSTIAPLIHSLFSAYLSDVRCQLIAFVNSVTWVVSVYTLTNLSIDRYIAISRPLHYHIVVTSHKTAILIAATWAGSIILWLLPVFGIGSYKFNGDELTCYFNVVRHPVQWIVYMVVIFVPANIIMVYCYGQIWKISKRIQEVNMISTVQDGTKETNKKNRRAIRTLALVASAFYIAWSPFIIEHIVKAIMGKGDYIPQWLEITIYVLTLVNSFLNPIIYIATNRVFRVTVMRFLPTICQKQQNQIFPVNENSIRTNVP